jgi:hypothetical protein
MTLLTFLNFFISKISQKSWRCIEASDEGTTPRVLIIGIPAAAQEQDGHSKPKKSKAGSGSQTPITELDRIPRPHPTYKGKEGQPWEDRLSLISHRSNLPHAHRLAHAFSSTSTRSYLRTIVTAPSIQAI